MAELVPLGAPDIAECRAFWAGVPGLGLSGADEPNSLVLFFDRNPGLSWGFRSEGALVATVLAGHDGRRGFLYHLAVDPDFRGRGLASRLLAKALAGLAGEGIQRVHVFVLADNDGGLTFWRAAARTGWARRDDLLVFSRPLP